MAGMLRNISAAEQKRLLDAMQTVETILSSSRAEKQDGKTPYALRPHKPGDIGWVVHRQGFSIGRNTDMTSDSRRLWLLSWPNS